MNRFIDWTIKKKRMDGQESNLQRKRGFFSKVIQLWREGFKNMTWGKPLWILNIIKLLIMFGILKLFFFPNFLKQQSKTEEGRRDYVVHQLVERAADPADTIKQE